MKKITMLFAATVLVSASAMAYLYENETTDPSTLKMQGYSDSVIQIADWVNYRNRGKHGNYTRYYTPKTGNKLGRAYQKAKLYVDPIQDDGKFGDRHVEFSNTWLGDDTHYSSDLEINRQIENL
jgi:hypothetical protein